MNEPNGPRVRWLDASSHDIVAFPEIWETEPDISALSLAHNHLQVLITTAFYSACC